MAVTWLGAGSNQISTFSWVDYGIALSAVGVTYGGEISGEYVREGAGDIII